MWIFRAILRAMSEDICMRQTYLCHALTEDLSQCGFEHQCYDYVILFPTYIWVCLFVYMQWHFYTARFHLSSSVLVHSLVSCRRGRSYRLRASASGGRCQQGCCGQSACSISQESVFVFDVLFLFEAVSSRIQNCMTDFVSDE
jgi:hypothetical protein